LPAGSRITDYVSLGVVAKTFPINMIRSALSVTGRASIRERDLPAHVMMYYVIAMALYTQCSAREVLRCLLEGIQWLLGPSQAIKVTCRSGISQARTRLGWEPVRELHDQVVRPIAVKTTRGAWYRQWRLVSLDGSTLDVADEPANEAAFGRPESRPGHRDCGTHRSVMPSRALPGSSAIPVVGKISFCRKSVFESCWPGKNKLFKRPPTQITGLLRRRRASMISCIAGPLASIEKSVQNDFINLIIIQTAQFRVALFGASRNLLVASRAAERITGRNASIRQNIHNGSITPIKRPRCSVPR
jgi:hypothetical protein